MCRVSILLTDTGSHLFNSVAYNTLVHVMLGDLSQWIENEGWFVHHMQCNSMLCGSGRVCSEFRCEHPRPYCTCARHSAQSHRGRRTVHRQCFCKILYEIQRLIYLFTSYLLWCQKAIGDRQNFKFLNKSYYVMPSRVRSSQITLCRRQGEAERNQVEETVHYGTNIKPNRQDPTIQSTQLYCTALYSTLLPSAIVRVS